ncbi:MAG: host specificity protein, partial [Pseudomonadota bacterium]
MATLLLAAAGSAVGGALGGTILGVGAATIGQAAGAIIGGVVDRHIFGGSGANQTFTREGPRLASLEPMIAAEGAGLPWIAGRARVSGRVIWATRIEEVIETETTTQGGGGGKGGG